MLTMYIGSSLAHIRAYLRFKLYSKEIVLPPVFLLKVNDKTRQKAEDPVSIQTV